VKKQAAEACTSLEIRGRAQYAWLSQRDGVASTTTREVSCVAGMRELDIEG
jgi:hypothetical protein